MVYKFIKVLTLDRRIREQNTGTAEELADMLDISRSQLFEVMSELKDFGAEICFSRSRRTYHYANDFDIKLTIETNGKRVLTNDDMSKISGGFPSLPENFSFPLENSLSPDIRTIAYYLSPSNSTFGLLPQQPKRE